MLCPQFVRISVTPPGGQQFNPKKTGCEPCEQCSKLKRSFRDGRGQAMILCSCLLSALVPLAVCQPTTVVDDQQLLLQIVSPQHPQEVKFINLGGIQEILNPGARGCGEAQVKQFGG